MHCLDRFTVFKLVPAVCFNLWRQRRGAIQCGFRQLAVNKSKQVIGGSLPADGFIGWQEAAGITFHRKRS